jgi:uncharacterized protein YqgC (DUF456 family)
MTPRPKHVLWMLLAVTVLEGLFDARDTTRSAHVAALPALSMIVLSFLGFYWYRLDSDERGYRRTRWLSTGIVALTVLAIPYYLARSRPRGHKARALLRLGGFVLLQFVAAFIGAFAGALVYGLP